MSQIPEWLVSVAVIAGAVAVAFAGFTSKYQKKLSRDREQYIANLEQTNARQEAANREQAEKLIRLEERVSFLRDLLLGKCPECEIDEESGGCRFCTRRRLFGSPAAK